MSNYLLQKKLGALFLPPKKAKKYRYYYEVIYREDKADSDPIFKKVYSKAKAKELENSLNQRGFVVIAVEYQRIDNNGEIETLWVE